MEHDSSRSGYHEPEPGLAGLEDEEDWVTTEYSRYSRDFYEICI